jgi:thioredoxin-dependent peroxiredoxin
MKHWVLLACALVVAASGCAKNDSKNEGSAAAPSALVAEGAAAPPFEATAHTGEKISLAALRGKPIVLYFYPKDDTSGCTKEACEIRDAWQKFKDAGAVVLGVSTDDSTSHVAFAEKYKLPFLLLPDTSGAIAKAYGVPIRLGMAKRVTFVIDREGKITKVFPDVNPVGHANEILAALSVQRT